MGVRSSSTESCPHTTYYVIYKGSVELPRLRNGKKGQNVEAKSHERKTNRKEQITEIVQLDSGNET